MDLECPSVVPSLYLVDLCGVADDDLFEAMDDNTAFVLQQTELLAVTTNGAIIKAEQIGQLFVVQLKKRNFHV